MDGVSSPTADVSVRVAWADDAPAIAELQLRTWRRCTPAWSRPTHCRTDPSRARQPPGGRRSTTPDARNRVLVALERNRVVGFAITSPASDPDCDPVADGELAEFTVDPAERGKGHGSRLLQAAVDTMRADRFTRAVPVGGRERRRPARFLTGAGWAPDSAHRELDLDGDGTTLVKQVRLHTALS